MIQQEFYVLGEYIRKSLIVIRGAGDLSSACAVRLHRVGFPVVMLEISEPLVVRRTVSFAQAVISGSTNVEGIKGERCLPDNALSTAESGVVAVVVDPEGELIKKIKPLIVIDGIVAKKNFGTNRDMAPFTIALGPGFTAGEDVDAVIETKRGHSLGRVIYKGSALPNTGTAGMVGGYSTERVLHADHKGIFHSVCRIGDIVQAGQTVGFVDDIPVRAKINGKLRGLMADGLTVGGSFKVGDVDPRGEEADHTTCSDKANAIAGGVLEAVFTFLSGSSCPTGW